MNHLGNLERKKPENFEDRKMEVSRVIDSILSKVYSWLMVTKEFKDCARMDFMRDWMACVSNISCGLSMNSKS